jgi:hypothetical protein
MIGFIRLIEIKGIIHDSNDQPIAGVIIEAFERSVFSNLDRLLAPAEVSDSTGSFNIVPISAIQQDVNKIYLVITDTNRKFTSVKDRENRFNKVIDFQGNVKWKSENVDQIDDIDITISLQPKKLPNSKYEAVVIGSGFGGTITSFTLANKYKNDGGGSIANISKRNSDGSPVLDQNGNPVFDFDARLSITEVPNGVLNPDIQNKHPTQEEVDRFSKQNNVCQRQGRCVLGCIPGARHTLNKQIHKAISDGKPLDVFPLCEVTNIEQNGDPEFKYKIAFTDYRDDDGGTKRTIQASDCDKENQILSWCPDKNQPSNQII